MARGSRRRFLPDAKRRELRRRSFVADAAFFLYFFVPFVALICVAAAVAMMREDNADGVVPSILFAAGSATVGIGSFLLGRRIPGHRFGATGDSTEYDRVSRIFWFLGASVFIALAALCAVAIVSGSTRALLGVGFFGGLGALLALAYRTWYTDAELLEIEAALDRGTGIPRSSVPDAVDSARFMHPRTFRQALGPFDKRATIRVLGGLAVIVGLIVLANVSSDRNRTGSLAFWGLLVGASVALVALAVSATGRSKARRIRRAVDRGNAPGILWSCVAVPAVVADAEDPDSVDPSRVGREMLREAFTMGSRTGVLALDSGSIHFSSSARSQSLALDEVEFIALVGDRSSPLCVVYHDGQPKLAVHLVDQDMVAGDFLVELLSRTRTRVVDQRS